MGLIYVIKCIFMLEVMFLSVIKVKYKKVFKMKDDIELFLVLL